MNNNNISRLSVLLTDNLEEYKRYLIGKVSLSSGRTYLYDIKKFIKCAEEIDDLQECIDFWVKSIGSTQPHNACHKKMCIVKGYVQWLFERKTIHKMPTFLRLYYLSEGTPMISNYRGNEHGIWQIMMSHKEKYKSYAIAILLMYGCGLRPSEVLRLRWMDINTQKQIIDLRDQKGRRRRIVPMPKFVKSALEIRMKQANNEGLLIDMPYISLRKHIQKFDIRPSQLRKSYIQDLKSAGVSPNLIKKVTEFSNSDDVNLSDNELYKVISCHNWNI